MPLLAILPLDVYERFREWLRRRRYMILRACVTRIRCTAQVTTSPVSYLHGDPLAAPQRTQAITLTANPKFIGILGSLSATRAYTHRFVLPSAELRRTWEPYAACR